MGGIQRICLIRFGKYNILQMLKLTNNNDQNRVIPLTKRATGGELPTSTMPLTPASSTVSRRAASLIDSLVSHPPYKTQR